MIGTHGNAMPLKRAAAWWKRSGNGFARITRERGAQGIPLSPAVRARYSAKERAASAANPGGTAQ